jgi:hypothetical protein
MIFFCISAFPGCGAKGFYALASGALALANVNDVTLYLAFLWPINRGTHSSILWP